MGFRSTLKSWFQNGGGDPGNNVLDTIPGISRGSSLAAFNADRAILHFNHWAYAAAMLNANAVANVPLRLYSRSQSGAKSLYRTRVVEKRIKRLLASDGSARVVRRKVADYADELVEVIEPHPALSTLDTVNKFQNGYELSVLRILDLQMSGNSYLVPITNGLGVPEEVYRLPPSCVQALSENGQLLTGYRFAGRSTVDLKVDELIHFRQPNPACGGGMVEGVGWFAAAWSALGLHQAKRSMDLAVFENMARPDWLLIGKSGLKKEALDNLERQANEKLKGVRKSGSFWTISGDVTAQQLNWKIDVQGTPTRIIEEISAVSGVPVAMLLSNDPNRSNSETARVGWYRNTIRPYCRLDEEKLNEQWLPRFDGAEDLVLAYDPVSFEDESEVLKQAITGVAGGIFTPNEGRARVGYEPHGGDEGDRLYAPSGATDAAATPMLADPASDPNAPADQPMYLPDDSEE